MAQIRLVSGNFLSTLAVRPQIGRLLSENDDRYAAPAAVVVSHRFWTRALGSEPDVVGRSLSINNQPYVIAGVLRRPEFDGLFPGDSTEIYAPLHHDAGRLRGDYSLNNDRFWGVSLIARRAPGVTDAQLRPVLEAVFPTTWSRAAQGCGQGAEDPPG